jgi:hypothetical protein
MGGGSIVRHSRTYGGGRNEGVRGGGRGGGGEVGEGVGGALGGEEVLAVGEDGGEAVIVALFVVEVEPPEEGAGVLEEAEVEGVLRSGFGEVGAFVERGGVMALPGEFGELGVGEAFFGGDIGGRGRGGLGLILGFGNGLVW